METKTRYSKGTMFTYSWHVDKQDPSTTTIRIYGLDQKNRNTVLIVEDFKPYVYLQLPDDIEWSYSRMNKLTTRLTELLREHTPYSYEFQQKKRLYYANLDEQGNKKLFTYLKCTCSSLEDIKVLSNKCRRPIKIEGIDIHMKMHENNASPILQLTSQRLLPTAGWVEFTGKKIAEDLQSTWCHAEYKVSWIDLNPYKLDTVARPLLMGFDIEVNSSIPSSMPKAFRPADKVFQISCVLARQGSLKTTEEKYLFTLGETNEIEDVEVRAFENEGDLLIGFTDFIQEKQPNVLIGYNILGFDIPYMVARAKEPTGFTITEFDQQSMLKNHHAKEEVKSWSSSAYKNQNFTYLDTEGRIFVDLLPLVKRDHRLSDYKLKTVASHFLQGITKDPLDAQGIFECYRLGMKGGESGKKALTLCGTYCVKDSELVVKLFEVLTTWFALCEMSKVTGVPIFSLYTQGQQLKVFSQVYRKATHENIVVERDAYVIKPDDYYVGATVVTPVAGVYDNVAPEDFSAMYPSLIIAYNMCFSTLVSDDSIPLELTHVHEWEDHNNCDHDPIIIKKKEMIAKIKEGEDEMKKIRQERDLKINKTRKDEFNSKINQIKIQLKPYRDERTQLNKSKGRQVICAKRRYRWLKEPKGVLPEILENLLDTRARTKKEMEKIKKKLESMKDTEPEYYELSVYLDILDQRQNALKVACNSGYGATGARKGYLTCMPVAMCTTYMGRCSIELAYKTIVSKYKGILVYGDSVTPDTPLLCLLPDGTITYKTIDTISDEKWENYHNTKEISVPFTDIKVWTEKSFTKLRKVIRHKCQKKIYQVVCHTGVVHVTEDHSLLNEYAVEITPNELKVGSKLLISALPNPTIEQTIVPVDLSYVWGVFLAEGSCGIYDCPSGQKASWAINNQDISLLKRCEEILNLHEPNTSFKIIDTMESSGVYKLVPTGKVKNLVKKYRDLFYEHDRHKIIPNIILNGTQEIRQAFMDGFFIGDGNVTEQKLGNYRFDQKGKITSAMLFYLAHTLGYKVSVNTRTDKKDIYRLTCTKTKQRKGPNVVKKIEVWDNNYTGYVYDIETENHHFSAGVGQLIVHNTDSNYISFPHLKTPQEIWDYATYVAQEVTKLFPPPMALAFEKKIYSRFLILTKKRYMSITIDREGKCKMNKDTGKPEISKKGVLLTRRDNCQFIRKVYESVIMAIFDKKPIDEILFNIIQEINKLCSGYYSIDNFIVSKSVGEVGLLEPKEVEDEEDGSIVYKIGDYKLRKILPNDPTERSRELVRTDSISAEDYYLHALPAQAQLAEKMRERGQIVAAGSRLQYIITTTGGHTAKQYLKIEDFEYFSRHTSALKIDYLYYLKQMTNPIDQVLDVIYGGSKIGNWSYRKGFVTEQYKFRQKVRESVLNDLRSHFSPRFIIVED